MKEKFPAVIIYCVIISFYSSYSQDLHNEVTMDILRAPSTPAFQLLDVDAEKIERPGNVNDFKLSILQATNNLSLFPRDYSIQAAPYWIFAGDKITYDDFKGNKIKDNILQTLNVSLATITTSDTLTGKDFRKVSLGIGFSVLRGNEINKDFEVKRQMALKEINRIYAQAWNSVLESDEKYKVLESSLEIAIGTSDTTAVLKKMRKREQELISEFGVVFLNSPEYRTQKEILENVKFERYGLKLDIAAGLALDFPTNDFDYSTVSTYGAWITFGWENKANWAALFVSRLLASHEIKDSTGAKKTPANLDLGGKLVIDNFKRFSISGEMIYRIFLNNVNDEHNKIRYTLNLSYEIFTNQLLTFNIGKEFDKKPETGGTLIAALNYVLGLGSLRPF